jgi:hypothetical protein
MSQKDKIQSGINARTVVREAIELAGETKEIMWEDLARARKIRCECSIVEKDPKRSAGAKL